MVSKKYQIFNDLEKVAHIIPSSIYWLDINNIILGGNERAFSNTGGTLEYLVGKALYDIYPKPIANNIVQHNQKVIQTGLTLSQEEAIKDITTGKIKYFNAVKSPLYDEDGSIIGTIGASIDITDQKRVEKLQIEKDRLEKDRLDSEVKTHKRLLKEQEKFKAIANQVAHDIRSPLASLLMVIKSSATDIPESSRIILREAITHISDIVNNLLARYEKVDKPIGAEEQQPVMVTLALSQILSDKKYQYKEVDVKFTNYFDPECTFTFIKVQPSAFKRMLSNIVNNAVEALEGKKE